MDFDDVLEELGEFGPYQITTYIMICLPVFFSAANSLSYVFTAGVPNYRCFVPACDDPVHPEYIQPWTSRAIPSVASTDAAYLAAQCAMYSPFPNATDSDACPDAFTSDVVGCNRWVFDNEKTIVSEWNITCADNLWMLSLVGTVHFAGILLGSVLFGFLADQFGRKMVFVFCILLMSVTGIGQAVSGDYVTFQVFVFINALGTSGVFPLAFIIGVELVGRKKREMSGIVLNYFYAVGEATVALVAWITKDWVWIQLLVSAPCMLFVVYFWTVPESVRWLLAHSKNHRASDVIKKAAKRNNVVLSQRLLLTFDLEPDADVNGGPGAVEKGDTPEKGKTPRGLGESILDVLRSRRLCLRSFNLFFVWAANAFVYYGLSVNSTNLGGDKYLNFALVCLIEIPGYTLSWFCLRRLGRRRTLFGSLLLCSITCAGAAIVPQGMWWAETTLFLVGKLGITSSFSTLYVFTAELYPTVMRSAAVGASSTVARAGAMVAPFAPLLGVYNKSLPLFLFGGVAFVACLMSLAYPETRGAKLPDTIEDVKRL